MKDRGCNTKVGGWGALFSPVLLAHHELCSCAFMLESSTLVPLLLRWRLSALYRSLLVQKESKLLTKPWPSAAQKLMSQQCSEWRRLKLSLFFLSVGIGPEKIHVLSKFLIVIDSNSQSWRSLADCLSLMSLVPTWTMMVWAVGWRSVMNGMSSTRSLFRFDLTLHNAFLGDIHASLAKPRFRLYSLWG